MKRANWIIALLSIWLCLGTLGATAQSVETPPDTPVTEEEGRQTLEDILARQRGEGEERTPRDWDSAQGNAAGIGSQLGTNGGPSDSEVWEALRFGEGDITVSAGGEKAKVVIQDGGMWWQEFRKGPLATYGGWLLLGTIAVLAVFFLIRGRIRIAEGKSGVTILRFKAFERFSHWLIAGSFILLALTGLITLFGRQELIPFMGKNAYATLAIWSKWVHNNVSWAFMIGLVLVFVLWVAHNIPRKHDLKWFAEGGGIIGKKHPAAAKFNAGQKLIFWSVVLFGASISLSGLSLLFPFELPLFAKTFAIINQLDIPATVGFAPLPEQMSPQEEMQYAQLWHAIVGFVLMAIIIAHIYIGTIGMQGAFAAMGSGQVDVNWAKEHHSLWVDEEEAREKKQQAAMGTAPAE